MGKRKKALFTLAHFWLAHIGLGWQPTAKTGEPCAHGRAVAAAGNLATGGGETGWGGEPCEVGSLFEVKRGGGAHRKGGL
jgi:hypothetical protein